MARACVVRNLQKILCLIAIVMVYTANASAIPAPGDADPTEPTVSGNTGAATFRVPIDVPPGPGGLAPKLALAYSSHAGDGLFGVGWSLEIPEIRCSGRFGVPNFASCPTFELGNTLLVEDPQTPGTYHPVVESFQRIRHTGSSWTVEGPDGTKFVFGESATHRIAQAGSTARWLLERMEDAFENQIFFEYDTTDSGTAYPLSITYGAGSAPGAGPRKIEFVYQPRPDPRLSFAEGLRRILTRRVREIRVFGHDQIARRYVFEYAAAGDYTTGRSRLASVQEFGTDCTNLNADPVDGPDPCTGLPKRTFQYRDANDVATSGASSQWTPNHLGYLVPFGTYSQFYVLSKQSFPQLIGDINGDGLPDRIQLSDLPTAAGGITQVLINTGDGFQRSNGTGEFAETALAYQNSFDTLQYSKPRLEYKQIPSGEWEGEEQDTTLYGMCWAQMTARTVYLKDELPAQDLRANTSSLADLLASGGAPSTGFFEGRPMVHLVDLDADGLADLIVSARLGGVQRNFDCDGTSLTTPEEISATVTRVFRNTGTGWVDDAAAQQLAQGLPAFEELIVKSSYQTERDEPSGGRLSSGADTPCANNSYFGFEQIPNFANESKTAVCHVPIDLAPRFLDFNGDGYLDLAVLQRDHPDRLWTGDGWWLADNFQYGQLLNQAQTRVWIQTPNGAQRWQRAPQYDLPVQMAHVWLFHVWDYTGQVLGDSCDSNSHFFRECGPATYARDLGVRFADVNGDGLTDVVWRHHDDQREGVLLNTGGGGSTPYSAWCASNLADATAIDAVTPPHCPEAARFIPPLPITVHQPSHGILGWPTGYFADLNGDHLVDFVWLHLPDVDPSGIPPAITESWIQDPAAAPGTSAWKRDARFDFPIQLPGPCTHHPRLTDQPACVAEGGFPAFMPGYQMLDIDGDGTGDLVSDNYAFLSRARNSDVVRSIGNGRGGTIAIEYASMIQQRDPGLEDLALEDAPLEEAEASDTIRWQTRSVVSRVTVTGPNLATGAVTEYAYAQPRINPSFRYDLGFRLVERTRPDGSIVREFFRQRHGVAGHLSKLEVRDGANRVFERREDWEVLPGTMPGSDSTVVVGRLHSVRIANQYPGGGEGAVRERILQYDDSHGYGFVGALIDERPSGTLCTEFEPYAVDETNWLVRRVGEQTQRGGWYTCTGTALSHSTFTYNLDRIASRTDTLQHRDGSDSPSDVTTNYVYGDGFGNLTSLTEAVGLSKQRTTDFCYDGDGGWCPTPTGTSHSVLVGVRDALGKVTSVTPQLATGIPVGFASDYIDEPKTGRDLDPFGRIRKEYLTPLTSPGVPEAQQFLRTEFVYHDDVQPAYVERIDYIDRNGASSGFVRTYTVLDGFGGVWKRIGPRPAGWVGRFVYKDPAAGIVRETYPVDCSGDSLCASHTGQSETEPATTTTTDALGRPATVTTPDGTSFLTYQTLARNPPDTGLPMPLDLVRFQNAKGDLTQRLVDGDRVIWVDECNGTTCESSDRTYYAYEPSGELATIYDARVGAGTATVSETAHKLAYHYDTRGRPWRIDDPDGGTSTTVYDVLDNEVSTTNARSQVTTFDHDPLDRLTKIDQPGPSVVNQDFDILYATSQRQPQKEWARDQQGNVIYTNWFTYDDEGRLFRKKYQFPAKTYLLDFAYDELDRTTAITYPDKAPNSTDGTIVRYVYQGAYLTGVCEVTSLSHGCGDTGAIPYIQDVVYDQLGRQQTVTTPAGTRHYDYTTATQRLSQDDFHSASGLYTRTLNYPSYDAAGNLLQVSTSGTGINVDFSATYSYDQRNRLHSWTKATPEGTKYFNYDDLGNLIGNRVGTASAVNQQFDMASRPHAVTARPDLGISYGYDLDGNLTSETASGGVRYYSFDTLDRLHCMGPSAGSCYTLQVDYDITGARVRETSNNYTPLRDYAGEYFSLDRASNRGDFHIFAFGEEIAYKRKAPITLRTESESWGPGWGELPLPGALPVALVLALGLAGAGMAARRFDWAPALPEHPVLAPVALALVVAVALPPIPARAGGGGGNVLYRRWILNDQVGSASVVLAADPTNTNGQQGTVDREVVYAPFGAIYDPHGAQSLDTDVFAGHPKEPTTGLHYMGARWQNPTTGTFLSVDPVVAASDPQSLNAYGYARNNPTRFVDPTGLINVYPDGSWSDWSGSSWDGSMEVLTVTLYPSEGGASGGAPGGGLQNGAAGLADFGTMSGSPALGGLGGGTLSIPVRGSGAGEFQRGITAGDVAAAAVIGAAIAFPGDGPVFDLAALAAFGARAAKIAAILGIPLAIEGDQGRPPDDRFFRVTTPGERAFQLRPGEEGVSVFLPRAVNPPLTEAEVLSNFRPGSGIVVRSLSQITALGLTAVPTPGANVLSPRLQASHFEIRRGPEMTRNQFKATLKALSAGP